MATKLLIHSQLDNFSIFLISASFVNTWKVACFRLQDRGESGSTKTAWGLGRDYFTALQPAEPGKTTLLAKKLRLIDRCLCCCSHDNIFPWFDTLLLLTKCNRFFFITSCNKVTWHCIIGKYEFNLRSGSSLKYTICHFLPCDSLIFFIWLKPAIRRNV